MYWFPVIEWFWRGDMAFHIRMPPIFGDTDTALWIDSFDRFVDEVADWIVVPGHGGVTDIATVTEGTKDYLHFLLRAKVQGILEAGVTSDDAYKLIKVVSSIGIPMTSWPPEMQAAYLNGWSLNNIQRSENG